MAEPDPIVLRRALADRELRPWRYYKLDADQLMDALDQRVQRIAALESQLAEQQQRAERAEGEVELKDEAIRIRGKILRYVAFVLGADVEASDLGDAVQMAADEIKAEVEQWKALFQFIETEEVEFELVNAGNNPEDGQIWQVHNNGSYFAESLLDALKECAAAEGGE